MSEEEVILARDTQASQESLNRLVKTIDNWATKEAQRTDFELAAFSSVLAEGIIKFENISAKDCKACPGLTLAITTCHKYLAKEHKRFDQEIDKLHVHFAKQMEELDLKIIRDRNEFKKFLEILIFADEYDQLNDKLTAILETVQAKTFYRGDLGKVEEESSKSSVPKSASSEPAALQAAASEPDASQDTASESDAPDLTETPPITPNPNPPESFGQ
jgi:hypothetical protein